MNTKKYALIAVNILMILSAIEPIYDTYKTTQSLGSLVLPFLAVVSILNIVVIIIFLIIDCIFRWLEKRNADKYSLYEWLGNPENPITLKNKLSNIKNFAPEKFGGNSRLVKNEILSELHEMDDLKNYKRFLELKDTSPRLTSLLGSSQTILIAVITASILTFLNIPDFNHITFMVSYFVLVISAVTLLIAIDYMSKAIDRDKLLLMLVNECIEENNQSRNQ